MSDVENRKELEGYLKDHYAGAVGALEMIEDLSKSHEGKEMGDFFTGLHADVKADHDQLHDLMSALDFEVSSVKNAGAWVAEKFGRVKLGFSGDEAVGVRLLQALETLVMGITGKQLLWRALDAAREASPVLQQTDFAHLEKRAKEQLDRVEAKRLEVANATFRAV